MSTEKIRHSIKLATINEVETRHLEKMLCVQIDKLHGMIELPDDEYIDVLLNFVIKYIEHVPDVIDAVRQVTDEAGISEYAKPFLSLAEEYFLKPPEMLTEHSGLHELMDEAYLTHRLIEEVNDRFIPKAGIPLIPIDMTRSNLIIHHLIGEPFANELDEAVHFTAECFISKDSEFNSEKFKAYVDKHKTKGWTDIVARWPCLTDDLAIDLKIG